MRIRKILLRNPSEPLFAAHLPLHKGGFGALQTYQLLYKVLVLTLYYSIFLCYFRFSSGIKLKVMESRSVFSWLNFTPADMSIRLEARVAMESAYLSDR